MKLNLLCPDDLLLLHPAHLWVRLLHAIRGSAPNVLAPALARGGTGTDLGPRSTEIRIRHCVECLRVCLPPLRGVLRLFEGEASNVPLCLLMRLGRLPFCNVFIHAQKDHGFTEQQAVEGYPFSTCIISCSEHGC